MQADFITKYVRERFSCRFFIAFDAQVTSFNNHIFAGSE